ncbi:MAG: hypothetical protein OEW97_00965 [Gammaproteobacteria bacterium]|nr:hypothetical protein [Gammaproteobacteria bacterium]
MFEKILSWFESLECGIDRMYNDDIHKNFYGVEGVARLLFYYMQLNFQEIKQASCDTTVLLFNLNISGNFNDNIT